MGQSCSNCEDYVPCSDRARWYVRSNVDLLRQGISVFYLTGILVTEVIQASLPPEASIYDIDPAVIRPKGQHLICPRDGRLGTAYVDAIHGPDHVGPATHMLSYSWGYSMLGDINPSLALYCEGAGLDPRRVYPWICCFCVNQHRVRERAQQGHMVLCSEFQATFADQVKNIGHMLALMSPWADPIYLKRTWCVYEMFTAIAEGSVVTVLMPPSQRSNFCRAMLERSAAYDLYKALTEVDVEKAQASVPEDLAQILKILRGPEGPGVKKLNMEVQCFLKRWYLDTLESECRKLLSEKFLFDVAWTLDEKAELCSNTCALLFDSGDYPRAMEVMKAAMAAVAPSGAPDTLSAARLTREIGALEMKQGNFQSSAVAFERSKDVYLQCGAFETEGGALLCDRYGALLRKTGDLEGAMASFMQGYQIREGLNLLETSSGAGLLGNIGYAKELQGDWGTAETMYERARAIHMQLETLKTPTGALLVTSIGSLKLRQGDLRGAANMFEEARQIREQTGTMKTPSAALLLQSIGSVKMRLGDLDEAWAAYELAYEVRADLGVLETPDGKKLVDAMAALQSAAAGCAEVPLAKVVTLLESIGKRNKGKA